MNDQGTIERMAEALLIVSQSRPSNGTQVNLAPRNRAEMQGWIRDVLSDPDERLAVVVLPHLLARLEQCVEAPGEEVHHG